jgi:hypothetical protein
MPFWDRYIFSLFSHFLLSPSIDFSNHSSDDGDQAQGSNLIVVALCQVESIKRVSSSKAKVSVH